MQFIRTNLLEHEKVILATRPHWIIFSSAAWATVFAIFMKIYSPSLLSMRLFGWTITNITVTVLLLVALYWAIEAFIRYYTSEYGVTNKRVLIKVGWIRRCSLELLIEKVEGVLVDQSVIGRILGYGGITIIGTGGTKDRFPYIPNPLVFRRTVQQQIDDIEEGIHHNDNTN